MFMSYENNKGADHPVHLRSLIGAFVVRCLDIIIPILAISKISIVFLISIAEQAGSSLIWSQPPHPPSPPAKSFLMTWLILYCRSTRGAHRQNAEKSHLGAGL